MVKKTSSQLMFQQTIRNDKLVLCHYHDACFYQFVYIVTHSQELMTIQLHHIPFD